MTKLLNLLKAAVMSALIVLLVTFACVGVKLAHTLDATTATVRDAQQQIDHETRRVDALIDEVTLTAKQARLASTDERAYLQTLNVKVGNSLDQLSQTLAAAQHTLDTTSDSIAAVKPVLEQTQKTVADMQPILTGVPPILHDFENVVSDPHLTATLANMDKTTAQANGVLSDAHAVTSHYRAVITAPKRWFQVGWQSLLESAYYLKFIIF